MTEELENAVPEVPRKRRKTKRHYARKSVSERPGYVPRPKSSSLALAEIDGRLAQAVRDRAEAMGKVSELIHWQDRLQRLEQEINSLIGFQQRLSGNPEPFVTPVPQLGIASLTPPTSYPGHMVDIGNVTSIPAGKEPKITPSRGNVGPDIAGEGGFS